MTFTYIQGAEANLSGFVHHLQMYLPLFRELCRVSISVSGTRPKRISSRPPNYSAISSRFRSDRIPPKICFRYFAIRKAWDLAKYASVTEGDLIFRNLAKERFQGARFEHLYRVWKLAGCRTPRSAKTIGEATNRTPRHFATKSFSRSVPVGTDAEENR